MTFTEHQLYSAIFLGVVALLVLWLAFRKLFFVPRYNWVERFLYFPVYFLARTLWRVELHWDPRWLETESSPPKKRFLTDPLLRERMKSGAILVANHRASIDPFFIQLAAGCRVHWMVAGEYFAHPLFGAILRSFQAIPTKRGGADNAATKLAIRHARSGRFVGMFPEGRINRTDAPLLSIRPGAALVAAKAGVPIIPIWIDGAPTGPQVYSPLFKSAHVKVYVGYPVEPPRTTTSVNSSVSSAESTFAQSTSEASQSESSQSESSLSESSPSKISLPAGLPSAMSTSVNDEEHEISKTRSRDANPKTLYVEWIEKVMQDSLTLGKQDGSQIQHAGKTWINS